MRFDLWTLALQTVNFVVLVWLLRRFLYKPVLRMVDARRAEIEKQHSDARAAEAKAKAALADIERERAGIEADRTAALKAAAAQAEEAAMARRKQAEQESAAFLGEARKSLAAERDDAAAEARRLALDLGMEVARRLLGEMPAELRAEAWMNRVEQHLTGLAAGDRDELVKGLNGAVLRVVTAVALPEPIKTEWRERLDRALGSGVIVEFDVDPAMVAGIELHFPNAILRFSWRTALASMRAEIEAHGEAG